MGAEMPRQGFGQCIWRARRPLAEGSWRHRAREPGPHGAGPSATESVGLLPRVGGSVEGFERSDVA